MPHKPDKQREAAQALRQILKTEDKLMPWTDAELKKLMIEQNKEFNTVTVRYLRLKLGIPSYSKRRLTSEATNN